MVHRLSSLLSREPTDCEIHQLYLTVYLYTSRYSLRRVSAIDLYQCSQGSLSRFRPRLIYGDYRFAGTTSDNSLADNDDGSHDENATTQSQVQAEVEDLKSSRSRQRLIAERKTIYLLGLGAVGKLVAHCLASLPNSPPITLLMRRLVDRRDWIDHGEAIELVKHGITESRQGFRLELNLATEMDASMKENKHHIIYNLIIAVKAPSTTSALLSIVHRLGPESTIVFLHNGMGVLEEVNEKVFPNIASRPHYMFGIVSHGVYSDSKFKVAHAGSGMMSLSIVPRTPFEQRRPGSDVESLMAPSSRYLLRTLTRAPTLCALGLSPSDFMQLQFEKLAINAVINPLTAIFDCKNGELRYNHAIKRVIRLLLAEISLVFRSLPELKGLPNVQVRFSSQKLEYRIGEIVTSTAENRSSMLQDVTNGLRTEIDYINGYVIRRGEELGVRCTVNYTILQMLKGRQQALSKTVKGMVPWEKLYSG